MSKSPPEKRSQEKRKVPRISLSLPVDLKRLDTLEATSTDDFTPEGVFIATREQLEPGTKIELAFKFPPADPNLKVAEILLEGEVVWSGEKLSETRKHRENAANGIRNSTKTCS